MCVSRYDWIISTLSLSLHWIVRRGGRRRWEGVEEVTGRAMVINK
jgi:hypothetical protein